MTEKFLANLFWKTLVWGHIEEYHNNAPEEVLLQRLEDGASIAASTFITEEGQEGEIADFVLEVLMERLDQINVFLSMQYSSRCLSDLSVIAWNVAIPDNISGKVIKKDREYVSRKARIVLKRNFRGEIVLLTAYPI